MPEKGKNTLKFQNYQRQMKAPYVIYADFESIIEKYHTCIPPTERSSTTKTEVHKPCGFSLVAVRSDGEVKDKKACCYRGEDCVKQFLATLLQTEMEIREELKQKKKMTMTKKTGETLTEQRSVTYARKISSATTKRMKPNFGTQKPGFTAERCTNTNKYQ